MSSGLPNVVRASGFCTKLNKKKKSINFVKSGIMKNIEMTAVFEPCEEGGFIAYVQEISGINTQGETLEEAKENLTDAVNLVFEEIRSKRSKGMANKMIIQTMSFTF
jgi:predicted RNase H-like HicB family nuclease